MGVQEELTTDRPRVGGASEVFAAFLKLGLTSFGGPVAHLGYFRDELVTRRKWIDERGYADLVALCQFLPGPASSQVGFALGLLRAGPLGAAAAWFAFTMPSAIALVLFALGAAAFGGPAGVALIHGLKLVAVAIVAHAVWGMARSLCPDKPRAAITIVSVFVVVLAAGSIGQIAAILLGALAGFLMLRGPVAAPSTALPNFPVSRAAAFAALALFALLLLGLPLLAGAGGAAALVDSFYRAGALVFGGGHVVLPLLEAEMARTGAVGGDAFLAGYGAAQAVPGPLFTFAAYLGAMNAAGPSGVGGAALALAAIFLPGLLLLVGALPFWDALRTRPVAQSAMAGANAAVVGVLGAALYDPVWTGAILSPIDFAIALTGFLALVVWSAPPWIVVVGVAAAGAASRLL
jgi:chromate transporter